ncbi:MAG: hypothetical protein C5B57_03930 [Blastocatellia bacterium]|nr:MAG: hypothetical protein C5B57_03930 [Blastocatellia bacterium]
MASERLKQVLLLSFAIVLGVVIYRVWPTTSESSPSSSNARTGTSARRAPNSVSAPDVHLRNLELERPKQAEAERNVFRFKLKAPPQSQTKVTAPPPPTSTAPPGPPPLPAIALKFIGIVERPERAMKIAVLRDPIGHVFSGPEGAVIEGRFRILRIGTESIEMAYLDGRGRQTIRLSGG